MKARGIAGPVLQLAVLAFAVVGLPANAEVLIGISFPSQSSDFNDGVIVYEHEIDGPQPPAMFGTPLLSRSSINDAANGLGFASSLSRSNVVVSPARNGEAAITTIPSAQPVNDNFTNRTMLVGNSNVFAVSTEGATSEPGEPNSKYMYLYGSVWYTWTAPTNGTVDISSSDGYVSYFGVYRGDKLKSLRLAAPIREFLALETKPGETFQIQFVAPPSPTLKMHLVFTPRPPNDDFTNRFRLEGLSTVTNGSTHAATRQAGEPRHNQARFGRSVWYSWVAPAFGWATLELDSEVALVAQPYTGKSVMNLRPVANLLTSETPVRKSFYVRPGVEYFIAVDGKPYFDRVVWDGNFTLKLDFTGLTLLHPTNNAEFYGPTGIYLSAWQTQPELDGILDDISFFAQDLIRTNQFIFGPANLFPEPWPNQPIGYLTWTNPPVGYYSIQARSTDTNGRALFSNVAQIAVRPGNDKFAARFALDGTNVNWNVDLAAATRDAGDPHVARQLNDDFDGETVWYTWTAPFTGHVSLTCDNWTIAFAVYTGKPGDFHIAQAPKWSAGEFDAVAGTTYEVLVSDRYPPWAPSHGGMTLTLQAP